jgi:hypothetical protein
MGAGLGFVGKFAHVFLESVRLALGLVSLQAAVHQRH